jgi:hypothetical protein
MHLVIKINKCLVSSIQMWSGPLDLCKREREREREGPSAAAEADDET